MQALGDRHGDGGHSGAGQSCGHGPDDRGPEGSTILRGEEAPNPPTDLHGGWRADPRSRRGSVRELDRVRRRVKDNAQIVGEGASSLFRVSCRDLEPMRGLPAAEQVMFRGRSQEPGKDSEGSEGDPLTPRVPGSVTRAHRVTGRSLSRRTGLGERREIDPRRRRLRRHTRHERRAASRPCAGFQLGCSRMRSTL